MKVKGKAVEMTLTVKQPDTGKELKFRVEDAGRLVLLHPRTGAEVLRIAIDDKGDTKVTSLGAIRSPEDTGKCIVECARDCNGSALCAAGCVAMCSTIILD